MDPSQIPEFIEKYGLPLVMFGGFLWLLLRRKLVMGSESDGWKALYEREREDRIKAENIVAKFAEANGEVAEAVTGLAKTVVGAKQQGPYEERLEGKA